MPSVKYYKYLNSDGWTPQGYGQYDLPADGKPGKWHSVKGALVPCGNGLHVMRPQDLLEWYGEQLWQIEVKGPVIESGTKCVVRKMRLVRQVMSDRKWRLFACDCAARALSFSGGEIDQRSIDAIRVARAYARGQATEKQLAAAWEAASDAALDAASDAALDAARAAAWAAAWDAASDAAWDAERQWQIARIAKYLDGEPRAYPLPKATK